MSQSAPFDANALRGMAPFGGMTTWTWIGRWRREDDADWPDPADLVDPGWDVDERSLVATYLEEGRASPVVEIRRSPDGSVEVGSRCQLCGADDTFSLAYVTDGTYVWPEGLAHYVETHSVRPPSRVLDHILQQQPFDFDSMRARAWEEIEATWKRGEHNRSWWKGATSQPGSN